MLECLYFDPAEENKRLEALNSYELMDNSPEEELDKITKSITIIFDAPISVIALVDKKKIFMKSAIGIERGEVMRDFAFCDYTVKQPDVFVVEDTLKDERFKNNQFIFNYPFIRFYAGVPLLTPSGYNIGTICYLDSKPRKITANDIFILKTLAKQVITHFELRKNIKDLKLMNEKTQRLSNTKEEFFSNMSHELRTPLNAISGFTENLLRTKLEPKQKEQLDIIHSSVNILISIVNDILDYSKIDTGKLKIEEHPFNVRTIVKETYELLKIKAQEKKIAFVTNVNKDVTTYINGDKVRLNQILINLIGNAIKFTKKGSVSLNVSILSTTEDESEINFSVKDTGIGIPSDKLNGIFDRFEQVEGTTSVYGGSGLGLSISRSLVEMQNGKLEVKSVLDKGSEFNFSIKYKKSSQQEISDFFHVEKSNEWSKKPNLNNLKVMLVEDNMINVKLIQKVFEDTGADLTVSENGKVCIEKLKHDRYDLVLMDSNMPVMDGYEATRYIRNTLKQDIPIIGLSANISELDRIKCINEGMNDYITKPFKLNELFTAISKLIIDNEYINLNNKILIPNKRAGPDQIVRRNKFIMNNKSSAQSIYKERFISSSNPLRLRNNGNRKSTSDSPYFSSPDLNNKIEINLNQLNIPENVGHIPLNEEYLSINLEKLKEFSGHDEVLEKELIELFLKEVPDYFLELENEISKKNFDEIKKTVHKMKSPLKIFDLKELYEKFQKIEDLSGLIKMDAINKIIYDTKVHLNSILNEMKNLLSTYH